MSTLTDAEKRVLERLLAMGSGYVLDFTDDSFGALFARHGVSIHGPAYQTYGSSKAKKLRAFWDIEDDAVVGDVLSEMLDSYEVSGEIGGEDLDEGLLSKARTIVGRLRGQTDDSRGSDPALEAFLKHEFEVPDVRDLPIASDLMPVIEARWREARATFKARAYLATIILAGSILEAVLLGAARSAPHRFFAAKASPKDKSGKVKAFAQWNLSHLIDVAYEVGMVRKDVKDFSHALRGFRNYVHANRQLEEGFQPDTYTAKVCIQVLSGALAGLGKP